MQRDIIILYSFFYSGNITYESVVELIYQNYSFFKCAVEKIYLTAVNYSSPTDGAQIIFNDSLLITNDFSKFGPNIQYQKTLIA